MRMTMYLYSKALVCIIAVLFSIQSWSSPPRAERDLSGYTPVQIKLNSYAALPIEQEVKFFETMDAEADDQKIKTFYIIGGMRLKLSLSESIIGPVELNQQATYTWSIIENGAASNVACASLNITEACDLTLNTITGAELYWQPKDWSLGLNAVGTIKVSYPEASQYPEQTIKFKIANRVIGPAMTEPEGSDVKMLEQMLWQLGLSGQKNNPGMLGARIASNRGVSGLGLINTKTCADLLAKDRSKYYSGWSGCGAGIVSTEGMIRRFQGRSQGFNLESGITGNVGPATINWLIDDWEYYMIAYEELKAYPIIGKDHPLIDSWLNGALEILDKGIATSTNVEKGVYTEDIHTSVLTAAGTTASGKSRLDLVKAWKLQESPYHWGSNTANKNGSSNHATAFRMAEGGADEQGSLSFSQLLYKYRYSDKPCTVHKEAGLNLYNPKENIQSFAVHLAMKATAVKSTELNCSHGGFYRAFKMDSFKEDYNATTDLKGYKQGTKTVILSPTTINEDDYELFSKGIGVYNGFGGGFSNNSWPYLMKNKNKPPKDDPSTKTVNESVSNDGKNCFSCMYSINIKNEKFGLPYRSYIWEGAAEVPENPATPELEYKAAWCFEYGEEEWMAGKVFVDVKTEADLYDEEGDEKAQVGAINCITGAAL
jgi:hypothetical protein